jgi:hypothetical protein
MVVTPEVAKAVADKGGPPQYVEKNWDRLVSVAQGLAEIAAEQLAEKAEKKKK